jgi:hypothetical protein
MINTHPSKFRSIYSCSNSTDTAKNTHIAAKMPAGSSLRIYFHDNRRATTVRMLNR